MYVFVASKAYAVTADRVDPWYGTRYLIMSSEEMQTLMDAAQQGLKKQSSESGTCNNWRCRNRMI